MASILISYDNGASAIEGEAFAASQAVSGMFSAHVQFYSSDPNLDLRAIVGKPAALRVASGYKFALGGGERAWTGVCAYAAQVQAEDAGLSSYEMHIVPNLWVLTQRRNFKIFQHLSIPEIVTEILNEWKVIHSWKISAASYPKLEHKMQYGESDQAFVSRLLEEAGIAFTFEFDGEHSALILSDDLPAGERRPGKLPFVDKPSESAEREYVTRVRLGTQVRPGALALRDYEFRKPNLPMLAEAPKAQGPEADYEQYVYRPGAMLAETGKRGQTPVADAKGVALHDSAYGAAQAKNALDALRSGRQYVAFDTNAIDLSPSRIFRMTHPNPQLGDVALLVTEQTIEGSRNGEWRMSGKAVRAEQPFRPAQITPKPRIKGVQSATVVGPPGEEIHVDEHGRVRVKFPWDRATNVDDDSSCWLRVNHQWAGTGYGWMNLPRVGQEVLVSFLDGDPDRPVLLGRGFNRTQPVPYNLPANKTISTYKSMSSPRSGGFNEIQFEDKADDELYFVQAEKDLRKLVKHDETITVAHDRHKLVKANELDTTLMNRTETTGEIRTQFVGALRTTVIGGGRNKRVKGEEHQRTEGNRQQLGGSDQDIVVKSHKRERDEADVHLQVNGARNEKIDGDQSLTIIEDQFEKVKGSHALEAGKKVFLHTNQVLMGEAQDITLKGPGGFVRIDAMGVTIKGTLVNINAGGSPGAGKEPQPEAPDEAQLAMMPIIVGYAEDVLSAAIPYGVELPTGPGWPEIRGVEETTPPSLTQAETTEPVQVEERCELQTVSYTCGHSNRGYTVTLPLADGSRPKPLEVIAGPPGSGGDRMKTTITMSKPYCDRHEGRQLRIVSAGHVNEVKSGDLAFEVNTFRPHGRPRLKLLANLWPWNASPVVYRVSPEACSGSRHAGLIIHAYPDVTVTASVVLKLNAGAIEERYNTNAEKARKRGYYESRGRPAHTDWQLVVAGKIQYGTQTLELSTAFEDKIRKIASINRLMKRAIDKLCGLFHKYFGVAILPELPNLSIEYEGKFQELKGSRKVDDEWKLAFKANPLIGLTVKIYVLTLMIKALKKTQFAAIGAALDKFRGWAKDHGSQLEVWVAFSGLISGEAGAKKTAGDDAIRPTGLIGGKLRVEVGALATVEGSLLLSFEAGAEIKAHTGLGAELALDGDGKGVYVVGKMYLDACKLEWMTYISTKVIWEVKEQAGGVKTFWERIDFLESGKFYVMGDDA